MTIAPLEDLLGRSEHKKGRSINKTFLEIKREDISMHLVARKKLGRENKVRKSVNRDKYVRNRVEMMYYLI